MRAVARRKANRVQRQTGAAQRDDLEQLAHLVLVDQAQGHAALAQLGSRHQLSQAAVQQEAGLASSRVIYLSPQGQPLRHERVMALAAQAQADTGLVLLCGRYEGVDERVIERCVDEEISIGDFVLSGGELPAMVLIDAIVRQLPGVLGDATSAVEDSFVSGLLDCPHYTRPETYAGQAVPEVLLSGNHERIRRWRLQQSLARTRERRPELLAKWLAQRSLTAEETQLLTELSGAEQCGE